jgi:hypothetical protein
MLKMSLLSIDWKKKKEISTGRALDDFPVFFLELVDYPGSQIEPPG